MTITDAIAAKKALEVIYGVLELPGGAQTNPYEDFVGKAIGIRTVTFSHVGRLKEVHQNELVLEDAACIMDWGRFAGGAKGAVGEVEPFPVGRVIIGRSAIVDCFLFGGNLPLKQQ